MTLHDKNVHSIGLKFPTYSNFRFNKFFKYLKYEQFTKIDSTQNSVQNYMKSSWISWTIQYDLFKMNFSFWQTKRFTFEIYYGFSKLAEMNFSLLKSSKFSKNRPQDMYLTIEDKRKHKHKLTNVNHLPADVFLSNKTAVEVSSYTLWCLFVKSLIQIIVSNKTIILHILHSSSCFALRLVTLDDPMIIIQWS